VGVVASAAAASAAAAAAGNVLDASARVVSRGDRLNEHLYDSVWSRDHNSTLVPMQEPIHATHSSYDMNGRRTSPSKKGSPSYVPSHAPRVLCVCVCVCHVCVMCVKCAGHAPARNVTCRAVFVCSNREQVWVASRQHVIRRKGAASCVEQSPSTSFSEDQHTALQASVRKTGRRHRQHAQGHVPNLCQATSPTTGSRRRRRRHDDVSVQLTHASRQ